MSKLTDIISTNDIVILSKKVCKFCVIAKEALDSLNLEYIIIDIDTYENGMELYKEAVEQTGRRTVPNIWYHRKHVGGSDNLIKMIESGEITASE
jgi:glutaredoxin 3